MTAAALTMLGLGALHGLNPGMGWLFAVGLGFQEQDRRAVWRALLPLALGHGLAIAAAVAVAMVVGAALPLTVLKWVVGLALVAFGLDRLVRGRHPRWVGMRVTLRDLTLWSLLMASAHGAGLMVVPFVLDGRTAGRQDGTPVGQTDRRTDGQVAVAGIHAGHAGHVATAGVGAHEGHGSGAGGGMGGVVATVLHTIGYLLVSGLIAVVVYEKLGLRRLRELWFNLDVAWGVALVATGLVASNSQARKDIQGGGVSCNGTRSTDFQHALGDADFLFGRYLLLRKGKRHFALLVRGG